MPAPTATAPADQLKGLFVTAAIALASEGGGVQRCTHEYLSVLRAAGCQLEICQYPFEHRLLPRLIRKLRPKPYQRTLPEGFAANVREAARRSGAHWIFINQSEAALALKLSDLRGEGIRLCLLSHGTDSCDYLHLARIRAELHPDSPISRRDAQWLGGLLFEEQRQHRLFDAVFCLSETDRHLEQWLGGANVVVLPRVVADRALAWQPVAGRIGTVSTLTHGPNFEGLIQLCRTLASRRTGNLRLRIVGTPVTIGEQLARDFPIVDYLGGLSDAQLATEAVTWCAFVNPLFCYPRGCSTKLAVPLEWRIPIATTRAGARGYVWDEGLIPFAETPTQLADLVVSLSDPAVAQRQQAAVRLQAERSPNPATLSELVRRTLS